MFCLVYQEPFAVQSILREPMVSPSVNCWFQESSVVKPSASDDVRSIAVLRDIHLSVP